MPSDYLLYIDGDWRPGKDGGGLALVNPATEEVIGQVAKATPADIEDSLVAAATALEVWRAMHATDRAEVLERATHILRQRIDDNARALTLEQGKTLNEAHAEYLRAIATFEWYAQHAAELSASQPYPAHGFSRFARPEPIGVVAAFVPWNYPAVLTARKLAPALAAGCCVILKGPEEAPSAPVAMTSALAQAGLPHGVLNLLFGDPPQISSLLLASPSVRGVTFTGSTAVGREIGEAAGRTLKRCVLELGGHSPVIVCHDADLLAAASAICNYKFECAGQSCNAPSRLFVDHRVYTRFIQELCDTSSRIRVGDGLDADTEMGPMANLRRIAAMRDLIDDALRRGGRVRLGGERLARRGLFWAPTILENVPDDAAIMQEEPFGPVLTVTPFTTLDEAIQRSNANRYGLASYVFTRSSDVAKACIEQLEAGTVHINQLKGVAEDVPTGGIKDSGFGYEGGDEGFRAFVSLKLVGVRDVTASAKVSVRTSIAFCARRVRP